MTNPPIRYQSGIETIQGHEAETVSELNKSFDQILEKTAHDYNHAVRSVHAKSHGVLQGVLTVKAGLPPELAQGVFAKPGEHKVFLRLSTNAGDILPDDIGLPRGLALKMLDVEGERLPGADGRTQDFVMVNGPIFQAKNAETFAANLKLLAKTTDKAESAKEALSAVLGGVSKALAAVGVTSPTVNAIGGAPNVDPLGETYYSVTPFRYGDYIAKFSLAPACASLQAFTGKEINAHRRPDAIRETVQSEMMGVEAVWQFRVQLCRDLDKQPIEDPTVKWDEADAPFETVATIRVAPQDSWSPELVQEVNEEMRFSVWTGLKAHQPLGNINRARRDTYRHSASFRADFNHCPIHEPGGM